ncbi:MAG: OmpA family protein [Chloroflexi bacterium]|nr:OmpA family protein [Chloroflexota bacterium]
MSRRAAEPEPPENHERWIVSYADMVTLLWALFVVLYAISDSNPRKLLLVSQSIDRAFNVGILSGATSGSPIFDTGGGLAPGFDEIRSKNFAAISESLADFSAKKDFANKIQVKMDTDSVIISLSDNLLFDSGSADLRPGSQEVLLAVANQVRDLPNPLRIEGHTDNVPVNNPDFATNWELSSARASTVLRFLNEEAGIPAGRLFAAFFADTRPIASNDTAEGRAINRRADIVIVYPTQEDLERATGAQAPR